MRGARRKKGEDSDEQGSVEKLLSHLTGIGGYRWIRSFVNVVLRINTHPLTQVVLTINTRPPTQVVLTRLVRETRFFREYAFPIAVRHGLDRIVS